MNQIVVIRYADDETNSDIMYVLNVKNYNHKFEGVLSDIRNTFNENALDAIEGIEIEDFVLREIESAGYEYEFTGFEEFVV